LDIAKKLTDVPMQCPQERKILDLDGCPIINAHLTVVSGLTGVLEAPVNDGFGSLFTGGIVHLW
jgi:hypothetical protein